MNILRYGTALAIAAAAPVTLTHSAYGQDTIKIGLLMPTSGQSAADGLALADGARLAVEEINAAGGVAGAKLELLLRDSQLKPDVTSAAAKELITKEGVQMIVGELGSGGTLALSEIGKQERVVVFTPSSKSTAVTANPHDYIFQLMATTDVEARRYAEVLRNIGSKELCFTGNDYAYTQDFLKSLKSEVKTDLNISGEYLVPLGASDFNTLISQLLADPCDTIVGTLFGGGFIAFVKQAEPFGLLTSKKVVWSAMVGSPENTAPLKDSLPEGMWANSADLWYYEGSEALTKYHEALAKLQGRKETGMWSLPGYITVKFLAAAIDKAGSAEATAVSAALKGLTIDSPLGALTIDASTHRVNAPEFMGPFVTVPGSDVKQMSPVHLMQ